MPATKSYVVFEMTNVPDDPAKDPWVDDRDGSGPCRPRRTRRWAAERSTAGPSTDSRVRRTTRRRRSGSIRRPANLIRAELEFANAPGMNMILSDFQLDVPLDDSLFSLDAAAGVYARCRSARMPHRSRRTGLHRVPPPVVELDGRRDLPADRGEPGDRQGRDPDGARGEVRRAVCPRPTAPSSSRRSCIRGLVFMGQLPAGDRGATPARTSRSATPPCRSSGTSRRARRPGGSSTPTCTSPTRRGEPAEVTQDTPPHNPRKPGKGDPASAMRHSIRHPPCASDIVDAIGSSVAQEGDGASIMVKF